MEEFKKGDIKEIMNFKLDNTPFNEGKAKLIDLIDKYPNGERWLVEFLEDGYRCERNIFYKN